SGTNRSAATPRRSWRSWTGWPAPRRAPRRPSPTPRSPPATWTTAPRTRPSPGVDLGVAAPSTRVDGAATPRSTGSGGALGSAVGGPAECAPGQVQVVFGGGDGHVGPGRAVVAAGRVGVGAEAVQDDEDAGRGRLRIGGAERTRLGAGPDHPAQPLAPLRLPLADPLAQAVPVAAEVPGVQPQPAHPVVGAPGGQREEP